MSELNLQIEYLPVDDLRPYEKNARKHATEDVNAIVESIKEFGFDDPIGIWKDNVIVEGHGRLMAAKKLGMKEVPCIRLDHLTDEQRRAYALAHNRTAELSVWDFELRDLEIEAIDLDMSRFGFDSKKAREDNYEVKVPVEPKAKRGEIYRLGQHRLMCGDSTSEDDVVRLCNGESVDMLLTDPPYNVNYSAGQAGTILNDNMKDDEFREFLLAAFKNANKVMRGGQRFISGTRTQRPSIFALRARRRAYMFVSSWYGLSRRLLWADKTFRGNTSRFFPALPLKKMKAAGTA